MKLHASGEDYLETILVLQKKLGMVRSNTLKDGGFITMDEDHFSHLSNVGRKVAEKIYERHCFFTE